MIVGNAVAQCFVMAGSRAWVASSMLLLVFLGGCGLVGEKSTNSVIDPGRYEFHNCDQLAAQSQGLQAREHELVALMQQAAQSPGGEVIGAVAYRTELVQIRGYLKQIAGYSEKKNCVLQRWLTP